MIFPMKLLRLLLLGACFAAPVFADGIFPGLKEVLTDAEWKRAGLDRLTPDQVGVIDAALIRHYMRAITGVGPLPRATATAAATPAADTGAAPAGGNSFSAFFGLTKLPEIDWRTQPPLVAKFAGWKSANRFALDNGQEWEGMEQIPFELEGRQVIIEARPMGGFALKLDEKSAVVRVKRVK
jgi:hypothetical protein